MRLGDNGHFEPKWRKGRPHGIHTKWGEGRDPCPMRRLVPLPLSLEHELEEGDDPRCYLDFVNPERDEEVQ